MANSAFQKMGLKRRGDSGVQANGIWCGAIGFDCPWAHPVWSQYLLFVFDITSAGKAYENYKPNMPIKYNPNATHEFHLYALAPDAENKIDFDRNLFEQRSLQPLTPTNVAYQFKAKNDDYAWGRVNECVNLIFEKKLSPDTDFRPQWAELFKDGWTLINR